MNVEFLEPASLELDDAIDYYNMQSKGLGDEFLIETLSIIKLISAFPSAWTKHSTNTRKAILKRFPYNLIYTIHNNTIFIIAVAHQHRIPEYCVSRIL